jgi:hypothetical protein
MILNREKGGYLMGAVVRLCGSFVVDGTDDPSVIRDGNSNCIESVEYVSAGLFTVTFLGGFPLPTKLVRASCDVMQSVAPSAFVKPHIVLDSYSAVTRSFQIQCFDFATPSATNPDDGDWVSFELVGAIDSAGTDAA